MQKKNHKYFRFKTRVVQIGDIPLGGDYPIRVQTMTNTNTLDTKSTVEQIIKVVEAGSEYVRMTVPSIAAADNLKNIKQELKNRNIKIPLIADVHFNPKIAEIAAQFVEKVRINPGNYGSPNKFKIVDYTNEQYNYELEIAAKELKTLIDICKNNGTAIRIGVNHGSLSNRIVNRYGDTPLGMVESAMEFIHLCENFDFHNIVVSMKSSNVRVMIYAYRLLVAKMIEEGKNYPLHLGVTEAGYGDEGRIKSAIGIGTLLEEGIGDTIRVSLTEQPEQEIPFAKILCERYNNNIPTADFYNNQENINKIYFYKRRETKSCNIIGGNNLSIVIMNIKSFDELKHLGYNFKTINNQWEKTDDASDLIFHDGKLIDFTQNIEYNILTINEYFKENKNDENLIFVRIKQEDFEIIQQENISNKVIFILEFQNTRKIRETINQLDKIGNTQPIILNVNRAKLKKENALSDIPIDVGSILVDGLCDGIWLNVDEIAGMNKEQELKFLHDLSFNILQATRTRITKTEYISCPTCGRTNFDIFTITEKIKERTQHLKGLKIGIMGCIVNGPGEMADADYGYVGSGKNRVSLYRGKEIVRQNIDEEIAVDELIKIIKQDGRWSED